MLRKIRKAQSTAEYAILLSLVIAAIMGIQNEVRKGLQGRIHDAVRDFVDETDGTTYSWEPTISSTRNQQTAYSNRQRLEEYTEDGVEDWTTITEESKTTFDSEQVQ
ncbi:MAG: hypothetical protein GF333_07985 [Candidatus Omnitrophica bacterium]|nr:hypothetical protein [Candidatus Omnitrophota bacterium]